jgi:CheY-like chemotaxis protein
MRKPLRVLLVEDSSMDAELLIHALNEAGYEVTHERVETADAMRAALARGWDLVLSDYNMPRRRSRRWPASRSRSICCSPMSSCRASRGRCWHRNCGEHDALCRCC